MLGSENRLKVFMIGIFPQLCKKRTVRTLQRFEQKYTNSRSLGNLMVDALGYIVVSHLKELEPVHSGL